MSFRRVGLAVFATLISISTVKAELISYYNFNTLSIATASVPGSGGVPITIDATTGTGSLSLAGYAGTVDDFGGTTLNAIGSDPAGASLSLVAGSGTPGNGTFISFNASLTAFENPIITYATQGTGSGYNSVQLSYSIDGTNFTNFGSAYTPPASFALQTFDLSTVDVLDGAASATFRLTFSGATATSGNNRIDNLQLNATAIPEPSSIAIGSLAGLGLLGYRLRRKQN